MITITKMKFTFLTVVVFSSLSLWAGNLKTFGTPFSKLEGVPLSEAIKSKPPSKEFVIKGRVGAVCKVKGCWMTLESGKQSARVKFEGYKFFVPVSLKGKTILAKGKLNKNLVSVEMRRHLARDNGMSEKEVLKITKPEFEYQFVASGVKVLKN